MSVMMSNRAWGTAAAVAAVAASLAGCGAPAPAPAPHATSSPAPAASAAAPGASLPESLVALECDDLVALGTIDVALGGGVAARAYTVSGIGDQSLLSQAIYDTALLHNGGMACLWTNGDPFTQAETFRGVSVRVLPHAEDVWSAAYPHMAPRMDEVAITGEALETLGDASIIDCGYDVYYGDCFYDVLVGEYWVQIEVKVNDLYRAHDSAAIVDGIVDAVAGLPAPGAPWVPAATSTPSSCTDAIDLADARFQLAAPDLVTVETDWGLNEAALAQATGLHCRWAGEVDSVDQSTLDLVLLPAADWNWDGTAAPTPNPDDVPWAETAGVGDAAWGGCRSEYLRCTLHVAHDSSWFVLSAFGDGATLAALVALANSVLD